MVGRYGPQCALSSRGLDVSKIADNRKETKTRIEEEEEEEEEEEGTLYFWLNSIDAAEGQVRLREHHTELHSLVMLRITQQSKSAR
jgi:hypothetical protein